MEAWYRADQQRANREKAEKQKELELGIMGGDLGDHQSKRFGN